MAKVSEDALISVIVPVYNVEKYIRRCIESIINQTYKNLEIILVDDGSPDNCPQICDEYANKDKRIKVIHKKNGGVSVARNLGIGEANGIYVTFVDADDYLDLNFIEVLYEEMQKKKVDYVACGYKRIYDYNTEYFNYDNTEFIISNDEYLKSLLNVQNGYGFVHMKLIKKSVLKEIKFNEKLVVGEDALFNVLLCKKLKNILIINKPLYNYRFNSNSVVRKFDYNYSQKYAYSMECMKEYITNNYKNDEEILSNLHNYIAYHVLLICVNYCYHPNNPEKGIKSLKKICNKEIFGNAIKNCNYDNLSLTRKISIFVLKHKLYLIMSLICTIRQKQFRK